MCECLNIEKNVHDKMVAISSGYNDVISIFQVHQLKAIKLYFNQKTKNKLVNVFYINMHVAHQPVCLDSMQNVLHFFGKQKCGVISRLRA